MRKSRNVKIIILTVITLFVITLSIVLTQNTYAKQPPSGYCGWFNPDVGYCDTGGIAACLCV